MDRRTADRPQRRWSVIDGKKNGTPVELTESNRLFDLHLYYF